MQQQQRKWYTVVPRYDTVHLSQPRYFAEFFFVQFCMLLLIYLFRYFTVHYVLHPD